MDVFAGSVALLHLSAKNYKKYFAKIFKERYKYHRLHHFN